MLPVKDLSYRRLLLLLSLLSLLLPSRQNHAHAAGSRSSSAASSSGNNQMESRGGNEHFKYYIFKPDPGSFHKPRADFYELNAPHPVRDDFDYPPTEKRVARYLGMFLNLPDGPTRDVASAQLSNLINRAEALRQLKSWNPDTGEGGIIRSEPAGLIFFHPAIAKDLVRARVQAGEVPTLWQAGDSFSFTHPPSPPPSPRPAE